MTRSGARPRPQGRRRLLTGLAAALLAACGRPVSQPEPGFLRYRAAEVVAALTAAGLPLTGVRAVPVATPTPDTTPPPLFSLAEKLPPRPTVEVESVAFAVDGRTEGGRLFVFDSAQRLRAVRGWFSRSPGKYPYVYTQANILLVLDAGVAPATAEAFAGALAALPEAGPPAR